MQVHVLTVPVSKSRASPVEACRDRSAGGARVTMRVFGPWS